MVHYFLNGPTLVGSKLVVIAAVDVMLWTYRNVSTLSLCIHDQLRALVLLNVVLNTFPQIPNDFISPFVSRHDSNQFQSTVGTQPQEKASR